MPIWSGCYSHAVLATHPNRSRYLTGHITDFEFGTDVIDFSRTDSADEGIYIGENSSGDGEISWGDNSITLEGHTGDEILDNVYEYVEF